MKAFMSLDGPTDATEQEVSTNAAQVLVDLLTLVAGKSIQGALITNETADIRFAFGVDPTIAGPLGHILASGQSLMLRGGHSVRNFRFVSKTTDTPGTLHITVYYEG
jgi:hypothetical protein